MRASSLDIAWRGVWRRRLSESLIRRNNQATTVTIADVYTMFAVNARREGWKNGHTFFVLSKTVPGLPVAVNRRYLVESVLGSLATAGATAATSKVSPKVSDPTCQVTDDNRSRPRKQSGRP